MIFLDAENRRAIPDGRRLAATTGGVWHGLGSAFPRSPSSGLESRGCLAFGRESRLDRSRLLPLGWTAQSKVWPVSSSSGVSLVLEYSHPRRSGTPSASPNDSAPAPLVEKASRTFFARSWRPAYSSALPPTPFSASGGLIRRLRLQSRPCV